MGENEATEAGGGGVGLSFSVVVNTPKISPEQVSGEFNTALDGATDNIVRGLQTKSETLVNSFQILQKFVESLHKSSQAVRGNNSSKPFMTQVNSMTKLVEQLKSGATVGTVGESTAKLSTSFVTALDHFQKMGPTLTNPRIGKKVAKLSEGINVRSVIDNLFQQLNSYNSAVGAFGTARSMPIQNARRMAPEAVDVSGLTGAYVTDAKHRVEAARFRKLASVEKQFEKIVGPTRGISLDTETANKNNDLWSVAFTTQEQGARKLQRNLIKDRVQLDTFNRKYVSGVTTGAEKTISNIVSEFHDAWAGTSPTRTLNGQLPPITGHNIDFDLEAMRRASEQAMVQAKPGSPDYKKAQTLSTAMTRLLSGDQRAVAKAGDTQDLWANFVRDDLGYTAHGYAGETGTMGNALPAIARGLGITYDAHDPMADQKMSDMLRRSLSSDVGKDGLKKMFNYDQWLIGAKEATTKSNFLSGMASTFGEENKHLGLDYLEGKAIPQKDLARLESISPLRIQDVMKASEAYGTEKATTYDQALASSKTKPARTGNQVDVSAAMDDLYKNAKEKLQQEVSHTLTSNIPSGLQDTAVYEKDLKRLFKEPQIDKALASVVSTFGLKDPKAMVEAKEELRTQMRTAYELSGPMAVEFNKTKAVQEQGRLRNLDAKELSDKEQAALLKQGADLEGFQLDKKASSVSMRPSTDQVRGWLYAGTTDRFGNATPSVVDQVRSKYKTIPELGPDMQTYDESALRVTNLAATVLPAGDKGLKTLPFLRDVLEGKNPQLPAPPKDMASAFLRGDVFEAKAVQFLKDNYSDVYDIQGTGKEQFNLQLGKFKKPIKQADGTFKNEGEEFGFSAHPDGFLRNKQTGEVSVLEAKYRGLEKLTEAQQGQMPANYKAQVAAYALAAGRPELPTHFLMGDLEANSPEIRSLQKDLETPNLTEKRKKELQDRLDKLKKDTPIEDMELSNLELIKVAPNKELQQVLKENMKAITGQDYTDDMVAKLPAKLEKMFAAGKKTQETAALESLYELLPQDGSVISRQNLLTSKAVKASADKAKTTKSSSAVEDLNAMVIESGNAGKPPKTPPPGGGGSDDGGSGSSLPPQWDPKVGLDEQNKLALAEKMLIKANSDVEKNRIALAAKETYLTKKSADGTYTVPDKANLENGVAEAKKSLTESIQKAQGLTAEVETLRRLTPEQKPLDMKSEAALALRGAELAFDPNRGPKAQLAAFDASAAVKRDGLTVANYKEADAAAKQLQELGLDRSAGYSRRQLLNKALKEGVQLDDVKLSDVSKDMTASSSLAGLKGDKGIADIRKESLEAAKAVESLFSQLSKHTTTDFMSKESKAVKDFIAESQRAQEAALNIRATAASARDSEAYYKKAGAAPTAAQFGKDAAKLEADANTQEQKALELAKKAREAADALKYKPVTADQYKEQYVKDQDAELRKLADRKNQLSGKAMLPGYQANRSDRDELDAIRRQQKALTSGQPVAGQEFSWISEVKLSTKEAEDKYAKLKLRLQQEAVQINAEVKIAGMDDGKLQQIISNNLGLTKLGAATPGISTYDAIQANLKNNPLQPATKGFTGYFDAVNSNAFKAPETAFDDLMAQDQLATNTVKSLYTSLGSSIPTENGLGKATKEIYKMEEEARRAIDTVAKLSQGQQTLKNEAYETTDPARKNSLLDQADQLGAQRDQAQLMARSKILEVEKLLSAARVDPKGAAAIEARTAQFNSQLAVEQKQLETERQLLAIKIRTEGGKHASGADLLRAQQLNETLQTRFNVGNTATAASNKEISQAATKKGINLDELQRGAGGQGKSKDFIGGAIDLLDWQVQWVAGVSIINTFTAAVKNSIGFAIQFEAAMQNVKLITRANTTDMGQLVGQLNTLTANFQYSAMELSEGLIILGQAGFSAVESLTILPNVTALATATMANLKVATDITTTAIEAFEVPMEKVGELVNTLAAMTIESKLDIEKLGTSFNYIASTAAGAGFSLEETGTAMGLMSNAGVRASTIGTSLRSVIGSLMSPTARFRTALAEVGLSAEDVSPATNGLGEIFKKLRDAGFDVTSAFDGLDKRIAGATVTLVKSADEFDEFESKITGTNRAFEMAEGQMDTFSAQVKRMQNSFQLLGGSWFEADTEPLKIAAEQVNTVLGLLKQAADLTPDVVKTGINSTLALTSAVSIGGGVLSGIWNTKRDIQSALKVEDEAWDANVGRRQRTDLASRANPAFMGPVLPVSQSIDRKRGNSLTGRNKQVYTTAQTLFDPKLMSYAAAITVGLMAAGEATDLLSGKTQMLASIKLTDKLESESKALDTAAKSFQKAAIGTAAYSVALKQLKSLGLTDFSPEGIKNKQDENLVNFKMARDDSTKNTLAYQQGWIAKFGDNPTEAAQHRKSIAETAMSALKERGKFWSSTDASLLENLESIGFDISKTEDLAEVEEGIKTAQSSPDAAKFRRAEARAKFLKTSKLLGANPVAVKAAQEELDFSKKIGDFEGTVKAQAKLDRTKTEKETGTKDLSYAAKDYIDMVIKTDPSMGMSGNQLQAGEDLMTAIDDLEKANSSLAKAELEPDKDIRQALMHEATEEIKAAQQLVKLTSRKYALKAGLKDMPQEYMELASQYLDFLTMPDPTKEGGLAIDQGGIDSFKGIPASIVNSLGSKLEENQAKKNTEMVNMSKLFKDSDGKLLPEIQTAINIKYKIQAEEIAQSEIDTAFKPLQTAYDKLASIAQDKNSSFVLSSKFTQDIKNSFLDLDFSNKKVNDIQAVTEIGYKSGFGSKQSTANVFGESQFKSTSDKIQLELLKLEEKRKLEKSLYSRESSDLTIAKDLKLAQMNPTTTPEIKRERELEIEINYTKQVIDLSRKRTEQLKSDMHSLANTREQLASKLLNISQAKDDTKNQVFDIVAKVDRGKDSKNDYFSNSDKISQAQESFTNAAALLKEDKLDLAAKARDLGFQKLNEVVDNEVSRPQSFVARDMAIRAGEELDFEYDKMADSTKTALSATEGLLTEIRDSLALRMGPSQVAEFNTAGLDKLDPKGLLNITKGGTGSGEQNLATLEQRVSNFQSEQAGTLEGKAKELEASVITIQKVVDAAGSSITDKFIEGFKSAMPLISKQLENAATSAITAMKEKLAGELKALEVEKADKSFGPSSSSPATAAPTPASTPVRQEVKITVEQNALNLGIRAGVVSELNSLVG